MCQVAIGCRWGSIPSWSIHGCAVGARVKTCENISNGRTRISRKDWSKVKQKTLQGEGCRWVLMLGGGEECKEWNVRYGPSLTCIRGEGRNIRTVVEETEKIGVGLSKVV